MFVFNVLNFSFKVTMPINLHIYESYGKVDMDYCDDIFFDVYKMQINVLFHKFYRKLFSRSFNLSSFIYQYGVILTCGQPAVLSKENDDMRLYDSS